MNSREVAFNAVQKINNDKAYINIVIQQALKSCEDKDRAFVSNIIYGTIKNQMYIDWIISKSTDRDFNKIQSEILNILRISVYQIFFMDKVPDSAICNEAVKLAKKHSRQGGTIFTNGVIRGILRNREQFIEPDIKNNVKKLSIKYSYPKWIIRLWEEQFGIEETEKICISLNKPANFTIRTNTLKVERKELCKMLLSKGIEVEIGKYNNESIIIKSTIDITSLAEYKNGLFTIQDESSMTIAKILNPEQGDFIIDMCAAPGGKTTHIGALMSNKGKILAGDVHQGRVEDIQKLCERLGIKNVQAVLWNAEEPHSALIGKADKVLLDAPCSGLGVIRRKADIKLNKDAANIEALVKIQRTMMDNSANYLKSGGVLVYSTCTLNKYENEENVKWFLEENKDFQIESVEEYLPNGLNVCVKDKMMCLIPSMVDTDGFFAVRLRKV